MRAPAVIADRFELEDHAGSGGMGVVYRALDRTTGARVAVKLMRADQKADAQRFSRESALLAELHHPGIVRYVGHGLTPQGDAYLAMEWLDGEDLSTRLAREGLTVAESLAVVEQAASALAHAHARGVIHRDVKPSNLFLQEGDLARVRLLDFGVARIGTVTRTMTVAGTVLGTPGYMAPEQARGDRGIDARADVFSLGCVLFECLTGQPAFVGEHVMAILVKILLEEAPRVSSLRREVAPSVDELVARMLAKDAAARPADAAEIQRVIRAIDLATPNDERPAPAAARPAASSISGGEQRIVSVLLARPNAEAAAPFDATMAAPASLPLEALLAVGRRFGARAEPLVDGSLVMTLEGGGQATDRATHAALCALTLRKVLPHATLMLATGRAVVAADLPMGEVIERAAARLSRAGGSASHILIDEVTAGLLDARFDVRGDAIARTLHGARESLDAPRTVLGKATPCVGRERELETLLALHDECVQEPVPRVALVVAPSGLGKSRLRDELLQRLRQRSTDFELLEARGDAMRAGAPYGVLSQALRRSAGILDDEPLELARRKLATRVERHLGAPDAMRVTRFLGELLDLEFRDSQIPQLKAARMDGLLMHDQVRRAWCDFLRAECRAHPTILVLDDLHWGDLPSVQLVDAALRTADELPLFVLALARPEVHELFPKLWRDRALHETSLAPLRRRSAEELVRAVLGDIDEPRLQRIVEQAEGHALFLEELIRAAGTGQERVPETVLAMVQARLSGMEPEARRLLRAASVFGERFWVGGVQALLGESAADAPRWLGILCQREVLVRRAEGRFSGHEELAFQHATLREAAYAMLTEEDRALGHRLAARWLGENGEREAIVLADHLERGGDPMLAVGCYRQAVRDAIDANDLEAAIVRTERGVACGASGVVLGELRTMQAEAKRRRAMFRDVLAPAREATNLLPVGSASWCRAASELVSALAHTDRDGLGAFAETLLAVSPIGDAAPEHAKALCRAVVMTSYIGAHALSARLLRRAEEIASQAEMDAPVRAWVARARSTVAMVSGDLVTFARRLEETLVLCEESGDLRAGCAARVDLGDAYKELGLYEEAARALEEALELAKRAGVPHSIAGANMNLCFVRTRLGALAEAEAAGRRAHGMLSEQGDTRSAAGTLIYLAACREAAGKLEEAEATCREALAALEPDHPMRCGALATLASVRLSRGDASGALEVAREAHALMQQLGRIDEGEAAVGLLWVRALHATGQNEAARAAALEAKGRVLARASKIGEPSWRERFLTAVREHAQILSLEESASLSPPA